jgi:dihydroflavonol-4-reductase
VRVAVTGGSGVVGSAVTRHLVSQGHEVMALARSPLAASKIASLGATPVHGDLSDLSTLETLVRDCEQVFHVAGVNEICSQDPEQMWRVNVEGTRSVMAACRTGVVERLVFTSSVVTIGEPDGDVGDESTSHSGVFLSEYARSKTAAERVLFSEAGDLEVVAVNPSSVQGPGRATGTGKLILDAARGRLRLLIDTTISLVDIDDCARGHLLAAEKGRPGERYILSGMTLEMREAVSLLSQVIGRDVSPWFLRSGPLMAAATLSEALHGLLRRQPPVCRETVRVMTHSHAYDGSRATEELGLEYTPVEETLKRTIAWFETEGYLTP